MSPADRSTDDPPIGASGSSDVVPVTEAAKAWFVISLQTFGGPAGQIAVMHRALVQERRWIGERRFLHALSFCTLLPGPEAQQLAIYIGWLLNGTRGGLLAGSLFVLPGLLALLALSAIYVAWGHSGLVTAIFAGLAPAVLAVVAHAVIRVSQRALVSPALVAVAVAAFVGLSILNLPFPLVILAAGLTGLALARWAPATMATTRSTTADNEPPPLIPDDALHHQRPTRAYTVKVLGVGLVAWGVPMAAVALLTGRHSVFTQQGMFFSGAALVTFGGAYAVLAYVAQRAVEVYGWLAPGEMVRGLALAETTPGPLIMVVQFVAFLGAYRNPGHLTPWAAGVLASLLTTWVTFVPCFVFIFSGAPIVERLRGNHTISAALTGVTAAVVGVIANLALYFAIHTLFTDTTTVTLGRLSTAVPQFATFRPTAAVIAIVAAVLLFRLRWSVLRTLGVSAALGLATLLIPG